MIDDTTDKKYELTPKFKIFSGIKLFRIKALVDLKYCKKGELGGYIEKEYNLSQDGDAWVYGDARVYGDAQVYGNAWVFGDAVIFGNARVYGDAQVYGNAWVFGDAMVYGNARVFDDTIVYGNARVYGDAKIKLYIPLIVEILKRKMKK